MSQAKSRLLELNTRLAQILTDKGVEATANETTTVLINKVADISNTSDDTHLRTLTGLIQKDVTAIVIPDGVTRIGDYAFNRCSKLKSVTIPDSVTSIGGNAFLQCPSLTSIKIPISVTSVGTYAFEGCTSLTNITIPDSVKSIYAWAFANCTNLSSLTIPASVTSIGYGLFSNCTSLTDVTLGNGFNTNNLNLSSSTKYTAETIVSWLNALADRTGQTAYKLTIGAANLAKLTEEQIAVATAKNWTLA